MLSYHNDIKVKEKYVKRFAEHRKMDEVIQGTGFENGKGCFVGCTLNNYDHSQFPVELGWPEWMARLADTIFEGLSKEDAPQFGTDLLDAVPVGVDLDIVKHHLGVKRMDRLIELQKQNTNYENINEIIKVLETVKRCHEAEICQEYCDWSAAWSAARSAASAESAVWSAAWSAARSAESAESAVWSAAESAVWSAESAARSAAESAVWSAESAARSAAFKQERDNLLAILKSMG